MDKKLIAVFIAYLFIRVLIASSSQNFSDDTSYYTLRQIENIRQTGKLIHHDDLSYGGRTYVIMPFYYYFMALFSFFNSIILLKIIQNIVASSLIIFIYLICNRLFKNESLSLTCAILASMIQMYLENTINSLTPYSFIIPGSFLLIYLFMGIKENLSMLIIITLILSTLSSINALIIAALLVYIVIRHTFKNDVEKLEIEYASFYILFFLWTTFILFKNAFQLYGFEIIYENIPQGLKTNFDFISFFINIGIFSIIFGMISLYRNLVLNKNAEITLISSLLLVTAFFSWLNIIIENYAVIFMTICLIILSGQLIKDISASLERSKIAKHKNIIFISISIIIIAQFLPGVISADYSAIDQKYLSGFIWMEKNIKKNATVLAWPKDGNFISYLGKKKNIMDSEYLLISDADERYEDISSFYSSKFKINSVRILDKYGAAYFVLHNDSFYLESDPCFNLIYLGEIKIYEKVCKLEE